MRAGGSAPGSIPAAAVEEAEALRGELKELRAQVQALRVRAAISRTDGVDNLGNASLGTIRAPVEDGERCAIDAIVRRMHAGTSAGKQENAVESSDASDASAERHADGSSVTGGRGPLPEREGLLLLPSLPGHFVDLLLLPLGFPAVPELGASPLLHDLPYDIAQHLPIEGRCWVFLGK